MNKKINLSLSKKTLENLARTLSAEELAKVDGGGGINIGQVKLDTVKTTGGCTGNGCG